MAPKKQQKEGIGNFWQDLKRNLQGFTEAEFIDYTNGKIAGFIFIIFQYNNKNYLRAIMPFEAETIMYDRNLQEALQLPNIKIVMLFPEGADLGQAEKIAREKIQQLNK